MNLYEVLSEQIGEVVPILEDGSGPTEYYQIWRLIAHRLVTSPGKPTPILRNGVRALQKCLASEYGSS